MMTLLLECALKRYSIDLVMKSLGAVAYLVKLYLQSEET